MAYVNQRSVLAKELAQQLLHKDTIPEWMLARLSRGSDDLELYEDFLPYIRVVVPPDSATYWELQKETGGEEPEAAIYLELFYTR